ncbi:Thiol:disulfide interchange protein DsbC [Geobacteraceae bacterium]|nr:Thiol:disulfide interchange protein DsbC [Geobacteraceae bacterium]
MRLKQVRRIGTLSLMAFLVAQAAFAAPKGSAKEESPEAAIKRLFPKLPASGVKKTNIDGFYEVVADGNVLYVNLKTGHVFVGDLFTREGKNLTAEARSRLTAERYKLVTDADKEKAVKVGNGKHVVIEITDPDCPFCRKMHEYWGSRPDVTRYVFFLPLAMHKDAEKKVRYILSAENKEQALWEVYSGELDNNREKLNKPYDDKGLLNAHKAVVAKLGIQSTPAFWVDGTFVNGANIPLIEKVIGKCKTRPGAAPGTPQVCEDEEQGK